MPRSMIIGLLEVTLHIPEAQSLKNRRKVVRSLKDRIKRSFNVSVAETEGQNTWQHCVLACVMVATNRPLIEREFQQIIHMIEQVSEALITDQWIDWL